MQPLMDLERGPSGERGTTLVADVGPAAGVMGAVVLQVLVASERTLTDTAHKRPLAGVKQPMTLH